MMETIEHLRELFAYNDWANRRLIVHLKSNASENARRILAHVLITEQEYYVRLYGKDSTGFDFWQDLSLKDCGNLARKTAERYEKLLRRFEEEGLDLTTRYKTSEGVLYENSFREMLTHIVLHSATHRGQVNKALREDGFEPVNTDYIIYLRSVK